MATPCDPVPVTSPAARCAVALAVAALAAALGPVATADAVVERVSVDRAGGEGNGMSHDPSMSADGRLVAFTSLATNLVPRDTNGYSDVFVHDRRTGRTTRVSVGTGGRQGNRGSYAPAISGSGRYVAFCSYASNLARRDRLPRGLDDHELEPYRDVFLHDRRTGRTRMLSRGSRRTLDDHQRTPRAGSCHPAISHRGDVVAYSLVRTRRPASDIDRPVSVMVWSDGRRRLVDADRTGRRANGDSSAPAIAGNGRWVAFNSGASDLVAGDTNGTWDTFVASASRRSVRRVSVGMRGEQVAGDSVGGVDISRSGRLVAFLSYARALHPASADHFADGYVKDLRTGALDLFTRGDAQTEAASAILDLSLSAGGRHATFSTDAGNVVPSDDAWSDVFLRDRVAARAARISTGEPPAPLGSVEGDVPAGGVAAFTSYSAANVPGDRNGVADVFVWTR